MAIIAQILFPIIAPLPSDNDNGEIHGQAIDELKNIRNILSLDISFAQSSICVDIIDDSEKEPLLNGKWAEQGFRWRTYSILKISADVTEWIKKVRCTSETDAFGFSDAQLNSLYEKHAIGILEMEASYLLLSANIALPGCLSVLGGYAFINGEFVERTKAFFADNLFYAVKASRDKGWPKMLSPSIMETWRWLLASNVLVDGIGVGRLGRALSALSHLTSENNLDQSSIELAWVLLGLEALYAYGNTGLKEQLLAKTEVVLGPRTENKKMFGAVYDFRSRLIHGDVDIPLRFTIFDGVEKFEKFNAERYMHEALASAVLIATLQWMVKHNKHLLEFEYSLKESSEKS